MRQQTLRALDEADLVVFVVDAREGVTAVDSEVARACCARSGKPVLVAANKVDSRKREAAAGETFALGFAERVPGLGQPRPRRRATCSTRSSRTALPRDGRRARPSRRPPSRRRGERRRSGSRSSASPTSASRRWSTACWARSGCWSTTSPGTTRDPIDTPFSFGGTRVRAGRHRRHAPPALDRHAAPSTSAAKMARDQLERCDVAVAGHRRARGRHRRGRQAGQPDRGRRARARWSCSTRRTWSGAPTSTSRSTTTRETLSFMRYAPVLVTSAVTRAGVTGILTEAARVFERSVGARPHRRAQQAARGHHRQAAAARRPGRPPRAPLLRDAGRRPPADVLRQHQPSRPTSATPTGAS